MAKTKKHTKKLNTEKVKIIPLGGIGEIGKNMTVVEYGDEIVVIDCGLGFPDDDMPGIDLVIPDTTYLEKNASKVKGILITHGHEDHIGAIPYVMRMLNVPIYATRLSLGLIESKLLEHGLEKQVQLRQVEAGDTVKFGEMSAEFIHVNHSIADACAIAIKSPAGTVLFSGDFKIDLTPIQGDPMNLSRFGELGNEGLLALVCESTNAERPGYTMSERMVGKSLENIFSGCTKRIVIATFSSNVHRVQQIISCSHKYGRKVAVTGRSMMNIVEVATRLGYMEIPKGTLIDINDMKKYKPEQVTVITTGSQGERMSALYRMAYSDHDKVTLSDTDLVVISATAIPGNEKLVTNIINELLKKGVEVLNDSVVDVHVSGHACQEDLKMLHVLTKPRYFIPCHGEYKHLKAHYELAKEVGEAPSNILIPEIGKVIEISEEKMEVTGTVPSGKVLVDGFGVGDVGNIVLRDRRHLALDGLIVVVAAVDIDSGEIISGPDIVSRGFVYVREAEELMDEVRTIAYDTLQICLDKNMKEWNAIKGKVKDELTDYLYAKTKRKPMILPVIMNL